MTWKSAFSSSAQTIDSSTGSSGGTQAYIRVFNFISTGNVTQEGNDIQNSPADSGGVTFGWKISHFYLQVANALFLLSNIQMDILYFRLLIITANIFLFLWGGLILSTALDVVVYAIVNILINIAFSIPLIIKKIPIKFDIELEDIYKKWFANYLSRLEFKILQQTCGDIHIKRRCHPNTKVLTENNPFESLVLFTCIPPDAKVIISSQKKKLSSVKEGQWVGVPEMLQVQHRFLEYEKMKNRIDKTKDVQKQLDELRQNYRKNIDLLTITVKISKIGNDPIEFLEFDYASLKKAFAHKDHGMLLENALRSIWMHTYMKSILQLDTKLVSKAKKRKRLLSVSSDHA